VGPEPVEIAARVRERAQEIGQPKGLALAEAFCHIKLAR
jgi:hypothetical protein